MSIAPSYSNIHSWTNLEDQIVKAGIQKYGTHQWSKIASLLQHKNAKQCRIRWEEYLNPRLNFNQFTGKEDAKLLELARRLPNQWRSIADAMGRTAQVCIERYNALLNGNNEFGVGSSLKFEYPNAETKSPRQDTLSLADEEREMLAEARARLLNTQGKKATRKIRERMLEESKRIAQLQKRRELKQAGEKTVIRKPRQKYETEVDYNEDVAYEREPVPGIYDTSYEDERMAKDIADFEKKISLRGAKQDRRVNFPIREQKAYEVGLYEATIDDNKIKRPKLKLSEPDVKNNVEETIMINKKALLTDSYSGRSRFAAAETVIEPHKTLRKLFASLPAPKNDFEIILDEDEQEQDRLEKFSPKIEERKRVQEEPIPDRLEPLEMDCLRKRAPNFIPHPADALEEAFNHLAASYMLKEPFLQSTGILPFMGQVERLMEDIAISPKELHFQWQEPEMSTIKESIDKQLHTISDLRKNFEYLRPLVQFNNKLCRKTCIEQLPQLRKLQQKYYIDYNIYQCELQAVEIRRKQFQSELEGSKSFFSGANP